MKLNIEHILKTIADRENKDVEEIRESIKKAIFEGFNNPDPNIHSMWEKIPCLGEIPTPDELIVWVIDKVIKNNSI